MTTESELNDRIRCLASDLGLYEDDPEGDSLLKQWVADNGLELCEPGTQEKLRALRIQTKESEDKAQDVIDFDKSVFRDLIKKQERLLTVLFWVKQWCKDKGPSPRRPPHFYLGKIQGVMEDEFGYYASRGEE